MKIRTIAFTLILAALLVAGASLTYAAPPGQEETTGITIHFDQPNSEPPQALLLAITPEVTGHWKWQDLVDTLHETLDMAKKRAVEPDQIDKTDYAQLLPAIMAPMTPSLATISLDFAANLDTNSG